jgi:arsenite methyltransferase
MSNDPYADLGQADEAMQQRLLDAMIARAEDPKQVEMRRAYMARIELDGAVRVVELGSGPGDVTRDLMDATGAAEGLGIEPSPVMVVAAKRRHADKVGLTFAVGDAKATGLETASVDAVALHTLLIHCPGPEEVLAEAHRILKPGGYLTVFDEDPPSVTAHLAENDPFRPLVDNLIKTYVHDLWIVRRTPALLAEAGFEVLARDGYLYLPAADSPYFLTIIDRGADTLVDDGVIGPDLADGLRAEARRRVAAGSFFGSIAFVSVVARKNG